MANSKTTQRNATKSRAKISAVMGFPPVQPLTTIGTHDTSPHGSDEEADDMDGTGASSHEDTVPTYHYDGAASDSDPEEPDDVEQELQRLVFGDDAGFRRGLQSLGSSRSAAAAVDGQSNEDVLASLTRDPLADLAGDAFFEMDTGGEVVAAGGKSAGVPDAGEDEDLGVHGQRLAWEDSDDERLAVSLASVPMLRKLRETEAEDIVTGREYIKRLRRRYELLHPRPDWAVEAMQGRPAKRRKTLGEIDGSDEGQSSADEMDEDGEDTSAAPLSQLLRSTDSLVRKSDLQANGKRKLRPEVLDIQRSRDIEGTQPSAITSLSFHPDYPFLLSSGPSSTLYLHHINPSVPDRPNPLLTSLHIKGAALTTTAFHPQDSRIFLSARRRYFHVWNLETGRVEKITRVYGHAHEQRSMERFKLSPNGTYMALLASSRKGGGAINILDAKTLQWTSQVRIEGRGGVSDFVWWGDSRGLTVAAKSGEVSEYNIERGALVARWMDQGAVGVTTLAMGGHNGSTNGAIGPDRWVAIGSSSGIVNIYDRKTWISSSGVAIPASPTPLRVLDNLTTPISNLVFAPDGQILAVSSRWKKDALRLVHLPSATVFKNWPTGKTPLGRITGVAFGSANMVAGRRDKSEVLAIANEAGKIRLWEIRA